MGSISKQLFFSAPIEKVWKIWTDVEKTSEWVDGVQESKLTSSQKEGKGVSWEEKCLLAGKKLIQMNHSFVEWEDKKRTVTETGLPMGASMQTTAEFKNKGDQTEATINLEWDLGIVGAMMGDDKTQHIMEKSLNATAEKWKARAES